MSYTLDELCYIEKGKIGITKAVDGEYPLVTTGESFGTHNEYHFEGPAVCVPLVSSTGHGHASIKRLQYVEGKFACGNILAVLIPKDPKKLSAKYLYTYLTVHKQEKLVSKMKGAANVSLTLTNLKKVELEKLPSFEEQEKLANKYEKIIESSSKIIDLTNNSLDNSVNLSEKILNYTFDTYISDYEVKKIPLVNLCIYLQRGKSPKYVEKSIFRVVSQKCVTWEGLELDHAKYLASEAIIKYKKERFLQIGDVLWNSTGTGTVGRLCLLENKIDNCVADSHVTVVRVDNNVILPRYLYYYLSSPYIQKRISKLTAGSTNQQELNLSTIKGISIPVIPLDLQKKVVEYLNNQNSKLDKIYKLHQFISYKTKKFKHSALERAYG